MIIGNSDSNAKEDFVLETPSRKRAKKEKKQQKSKRPRFAEEAVENSENLDTSDEEKQDVAHEIPESPIYIPTLSSPEPESPEACVDTPIQSHANLYP